MFLLYFIYLLLDIIILFQCENIIGYLLTVLRGKIDTMKNVILPLIVKTADLTYSATELVATQL